MGTRIRAHHERYVQEVKRIKSNLLEQSLIFAKEQKYAESILIGVGGLRDLIEIIKTWKADTRNRRKVLHETWRIEDKTKVDPRYWPR